MVLSSSSPLSSPENVGPRRRQSTPRALTAVTAAVLASLMAACSQDKVSDVDDLAENPDCIETLNPDDVTVTTVLTGRDGFDNPKRDVDVSMSGVTKESCANYLADLGGPDGAIVKMDGEVAVLIDATADNDTTTATDTLWGDDIQFGNSSSSEDSLPSIGVNFTLDEVSQNPVIGVVPWSYGNDDLTYGLGLMAIKSISCPDVAADDSETYDCTFEVVDPEVTTDIVTE